MLLFQAIQVGAQRSRLRPISHRIKSGIGSDLLESPAVHVALRAEMQLFCPSFFAIQVRTEHHHEGGKLGVLCIAGGLTRANTAKDALRHRRRAEIDEAVVEGMIRQATARAMESIVALLNGIEEAIEVRHLYVGGGAQTVDPGIESVRILDR